jgi:Kef-type K+ transport system membrane component KefB
MKYTKGQIAVLILGFASIVALLLFAFSAVITQSNGARILKPGDWLTLGLMIVWLVGGVYLLKRFRRPR